MNVCPVVERMVDRGHFTLQELEAHVQGCPVCQAILDEVEQDIREALDGDL